MQFLYLPDRIDFKLILSRDVRKFTSYFANTKTYYNSKYIHINTGIPNLKICYQIDMKLQISYNSSLDLFYFSILTT